ncbi:MAG: MaoC family dehydratase [Lachnospiraceae bacterium]|nr:MaoC family dehydratase [Lachnospiraceae bacterium]
MSKKYELPLKVGDSCQFVKTVSESDVYLFSGITGDFSQMHFNEEFMKTTQYGTRIVQGVLTFALSCTASTNLQIQMNSPIPSASYGYDHLRFVKPVFFGDTITCTETAAKLDPENMKVYLDVVVTNQRDEVVLVATHILKFLPPVDED